MMAEVKLTSPGPKQPCGKGSLAENGQLTGLGYLLLFSSAISFFVAMYIDQILYLYRGYELWAPLIYAMIYFFAFGYFFKLVGELKLCKCFNRRIALLVGLTFWPTMILVLPAIGKFILTQ